MVLQQRPGKRRRLVLWLLLPPLLIGGCMTGCWWSFQPTIGTAETADKAPIPGLPAQAKRIAYFLPGAFGPSKSYEFDISEADFEMWVQSMPEPKLAPSPWRRVTRYEPWVGTEVVYEFADGPVYFWRHEDEGVTAAYDRKLGRAFYRRSYR